MRNNKNRSPVFLYSRFLFLSFSFILLSSIFTSCSDRNPTNPYDPEVGAEFPAATLISVSNFGLAKIEVKFSSNYEYFTKYQLERSLLAASGYTLIDEIPAETIAYQTYIDSLINANTDYYYRIRGMVDELPGPYSNTMNYSLSITPPVNILAWSPNDHKIGMSWNMSMSTTKMKENNRESYEFGTSIERRINTGSFEEIARLESSITGFTDSTLSVNTVYTYRLRTYLNQSYSIYSVESTLQTQIINTPTQLTAEPLSDQQIALSWQDNCYFETGYVIERKEINGEFSIIAELAADCTSHIDSDLLLGMEYTYRIQAFTSWNVSDYSVEEVVTLIMQAPTNLTTDALNDQEVILTWDDNSSFEEGFIIERSDDNGNFVEIVSLLNDMTEYMDEGLDFGTEYTYRVRAFFSQYYSNFSNESTIQTIFPAPTNLISTLISDSSVQINWDDNCAFEEGYVIERRDAGSSFVQIASVQPDNLTFTDIDLLYGLEYTYRVLAYTSLNVSYYTNETNLLIEIIAPSELAAIAGSTSITLNWIDNSQIEENFEIERKITGEDFQLIAIVNNNIETFIDINVELLTTYFYRVRAVTLNNQSVYSNIANATITGN